jgi:hypothetical protein
VGGPLEELNLAGPLEDLDFSESSGFSFPAEAAAGGEAPAEALPADAETAEFRPEVALPGGEPAAATMPGMVPELAQEGLPEAGEAPAEPPAPEAEPAETAPAPKWHKWLAHVDWVGVALLAIAIWLVVRVITVNVAWITAYLVLLVLIPFSLWKTRNRWMTPQITAVYTVLLAISTAALLTAVFWLGLELAQYHWDVKAKTRPVVGAVERDWGLGIRGCGLAPVLRRFCAACGFAPPATGWQSSRAPKRYPQPAVHCYSAGASTMAAACPIGNHVTERAAEARQGIGPPWMTMIGHSGSGCS